MRKSQSGWKCIGKGLVFVLAVALFMAATSSVSVQAYPGDHHHHRHREHRNPRDIDGKIKVINETDFDMYITCDGRNLGRVTRNSSEEFWVKCGEMYVVAEINGDCKASKDVDIDPRRRHEEVTFYNNDFMRLPERPN